MGKIKDWYLKPRKGKIFEFVNWILLNPHAFEIMIAMSHIVSFIIFVTVTIFVGIWSEWNPFALILPVLMLGLTTKNLYKYIKLKIKTKGEFIYEDLTLNDVTGRK